MYIQNYYPPSIDRFACMCACVCVYACMYASIARVQNPYESNHFSTESLSRYHLPSAKFSFPHFLLPPSKDAEYIDPSRILFALHFYQCTCHRYFADLDTVPFMDSRRHCCLNKNKKLSIRIPNVCVKRYTYIPIMQITQNSKRYPQDIYNIRLLKYYDVHWALL